MINNNLEQYLHSLNTLIRPYAFLNIDLLGITFRAITGLNPYAQQADGHLIMESS